MIKAKNGFTLDFERTGVGLEMRKFCTSGFKSKLKLKESVAGEGRSKAPADFNLFSLERKK